MMRTLSETYISKWHLHVNILVHAYNSSPNGVIGYSKFKPMFGRPPCLTIDIMFGATAPGDEQQYYAYAEGWRQATAEAHKIALDSTGNLDHNQRKDTTMQSN